MLTTNWCFTTVGTSGISLAFGIVFPCILGRRRVLINYVVPRKFVRKAYCTYYFSASLNEDRSQQTELEIHRMQVDSKIQCHSNARERNRRDIPGASIPLCPYARLTL